MSTPLAVILVVYLAVLALLALLAAAGVPCTTAVRTGVVVAEALLLMQLAVDLVSLASGHRPEELATHFGYGVVSVALLPLLSRRSPEPTPSDQLVTTVAALVAIVVTVRMRVTWSAA